MIIIIFVVLHMLAFVPQRSQNRAYRDLVRMCCQFAAPVIDVANDRGSAALHMACANGNLRVAEALLENLANPNALALSRGRQRTPLDMATEANKDQALERSGLINKFGLFASGSPEDRF